MKFRVSVIMAALIALLILGTLTVAAGPLPGAIFTTLVDGSRVNANIYQAKEDVYLDGGPGPNAPISAAGLNEGDYFFQVTDPSGKTLLSTDAVKCRRFHVNGSGIIDGVVPSTWLQKIRGRIWEADCTHLMGTDVDHGAQGAKTVQLMPFDNTPNNGGVYKVWVTPVERFAGDADQVDSPSAPGSHGFLPSWSKTDNFKVKGKCPDPPVIVVRKFEDSNANGCWDDGEEEIYGWPIEICDPLGVSNSWFTKVEQQTCPAGVWQVTEATAPADSECKWRQTAVYVDGYAITPVCSTVEVDVAGNCGESHEVIYGNVPLGKICGKKFYDRNGNGRRDDGEPPIPGIKLRLVGNGVDEIKETGANGIACFGELLPGEYTISELLPCNSSDVWVPTTPTSVGVKLCGCDSLVVEFGNSCTGTTAFGTKGYWHNKNGLQEIVDADIAFVNGLACNGKPGPYQAASSYFDAGDEPFNGKFQDGSDVAGVNGESAEEIAPAGSPKAEISQFLVDANAGGDPREQLAQQLLAFIFNCRHRLDGPGVTILSPGGPVSASDLICQAVTAWQGTDAAKQHEIAGILDEYNNCQEVKFIHGEPCPVVYCNTPSL